jgi:exonuclease VII small subunit
MRSEQSNLEGELADYEKAIALKPDYDSALQNREDALQKIKK